MPRRISLKPKKTYAKQQPAAKRLRELLRRRGVIPFGENLPYRKSPGVVCSIYGAPATNELFVKLTNGKTTFVEVTKSEMSSPAMADRILGMDVLDAAVAFGLAKRMWKEHKCTLITA